MLLSVEYNLKLMDHKLAQWVRMSAAKPDEMSLISRTHTEDSENRSLREVL